MKLDTVLPGGKRRYAGEEVGGRADHATLATAEAVLAGTSKKGFLARLLPFLGPAFIASIAYIDPGNFATNIQGGAQYGYLLVWVVIASNLMAMLIQTLSAKLGIATGRNLAEIMGSEYPRAAVWGLWGLAEIAAMATDLAEFLGAAVGLNLLFGIPLLWAGLLTGVATFGILALQQYGFRPLEAIITAFVGVIALCYVVETFLSKPDFGAVGAALIMPRFAGADSVLLASGILGATVMPHVIFLHSALTQDRVVARDSAQRRRLFRFELVDVLIALGLAGFVNAAMLIMAAVTYYNRGILGPNDDLILKAYQTLTPLLGGAASLVFGISLLASGLSSSTVGTMAGQVIMRGFLGWQIPLWLRRGITMVPALAVIALGIEATKALVISQVVLSFVIPFALVPLVRFTRRDDLMGDLVNRRLTTAAAYCVAALIIVLNAFLLYQTFFG
ncbi:MAG TPA: Nramp family divalent metal transporter [Thermomicrobiales bacterium]|nr:Nramp family divalent metal transporter [Thermomicrobiales bacterium]